MNVLLLSNQLIDYSIIKKILKTDELKVTIYESKTFYVINKKPISKTKYNYFKKCLTEYRKRYNPIIINSLAHLNKDIEYNYFDMLDLEIEKELEHIGKTINFIKHYNPMFLLNHVHRQYWIDNHKTFTFNIFYKWCRETLNIFPKPIGGKWSYDKDNQNTMPKEIYDSIDEIKEIYFPTNREDAKSWLKQFIRYKLNMFGPYQDTILEKNLILWHAGISPMLNMGLLLPIEVIKLIPSSDQWSKKVISSYEGFLRQLFWREYMAMIYRVNIKIKNTFNSINKLPTSWYSITNKITGIELIDKKIVQSIKYGYLHHIERLMLIGNFMLLASFKPIDVYDWFMRNFIDAHHWVMVGNVYHMLLWTTGRVMTQRPYIASSTYLKKMAKMSVEDCKKWDEYYMKFIIKNKSILSHTYMSSGHLKRANNLKNKVI